MNASRFNELPSNVQDEMIKLINMFASHECPRVNATQIIQEAKNTVSEQFHNNTTKIGSPMNPEQVRELLETQRKSLIDMFEKENQKLLDKYISLQIKYVEMKVDRDILSKNYNELVNLRCLEV